MRAVSVDHYENFPVASVLSPAHLRPAIQALYAFARTADDIADEGSASASERLADLTAYRADLAAVCHARPPGPRWPGVFMPLARVVAQHGLPEPLLAALLDAFEQDLRVNRYADRATLLDYCRRSANPVGRLLLHLYRVDDPVSLSRSDAICSALQLINFWQDLGIDVKRDRLYLPLADCERHQVDPRTVLAGQDSPRLRALLAELVSWSRELMLAGAPLALDLPGRVGWELRLVVQGGLRITDKLQRHGHDALSRRPTVGASDAPLLLWRALTMSRSGLAAQGARA